VILLSLLVGIPMTGLKQQSAFVMDCLAVSVLVVIDLFIVMIQIHRHGKNVLNFEILYVKGADVKGVMLV
jgi:hypothetical protein